jgi:hypothetical protein
MSSDLRRIFLESHYAREENLQNALLGVLKDLGFTFRYHTHDSRRSQEGFSDVVAINPTAGVLWVAELKGLKTPTTTAQLEWLDAWRSVKRVIVPAVIRPADYDRAVDQLASAVHGNRIAR